jgi:predicted hydrolase (HD superfamily)
MQDFHGKPLPPHLNFCYDHRMAENPSYSMPRAEAWELLKQYNKDPFHLQHALTVEGVMKWFAVELGFGSEAEFWGNVGLLHDIDFEMYPDEHCLKAPELLRAGGADEALVHAVCSHGYGLTVDIKPEHEMEKVLYAADELTGLIWAVAIVRPSKSVDDLEVKSVKKKFKALNFAAGCSREVIERGAAMLGWDLDKLIEKTILAMRSCARTVEQAESPPLQP